MRKVVQELGNAFLEQTFQTICENEVHHADKRQVSRSGNYYFLVKKNLRY